MPHLIIFFILGTSEQTRPRDTRSHSSGSESAVGEVEGKAEVGTLLISTIRHATRKCDHVPSSLFVFLFRSPTP